MKSFLFVLLTFLTFSLSSAQLRTAGIVLGLGGTIVDNEKAAGWESLDDWDNLAYIIKASGEYQIGEGLVLGADLGINRLYYWEYDWSRGYVNTEWTINLGINIAKYFSEQFYLRGGVGLHAFWSGGVVPGLLGAIGYDIYLSDKLVLPLELRIEPVFGAATPIPVMIGTGFKFLLF